MYKIFLLTLTVLLVQCTRQPNPVAPDPIPAVDTPGVVNPHIAQALKDSCGCQSKPYSFSHYTDLTFSNNWKPFNQDSLTRWVRDPKRLKIKSLTLIDFGTLPAGMEIFENVERIDIQSINFPELNGLDMFPKLKAVKFEECRVDMSKQEKWPGRIEVLVANKTEFRGLKSFKSMPNLKELRISFSGFDVFPADFNSMHCLRHFQTNAHTFGEVDMTKVDTSGMPCLEHLEFHSWR